MTDIDTLANDIRAVDGDNTLGAGELAEKLVALGYGKVEDTAPLHAEISRLTAELEAAKTEKPVVVKKLSDYQNGEDVEVIKNGEWTKGIVNGVERKLNLVYVHTSRGPATVGNPSSIRAVRAD